MDDDKIGFRNEAAMKFRLPETTQKYIDIVSSLLDADLQPVYHEHDVFATDILLVQILRLMREKK